ncbi:MAG TPA: UDP-N-acetylmuramate dehydrogenase, partial [Bacillota bacterium]|nr:UDP-N-acetylmuramate dehydrogenase [Bacillota bacterium]
MSVSEQAITTLRNQLVDAGYWDLEENLKKNEPMNTHTSFRVGGPAEIYAEPTNLKEVIMLIQIAKSLEIPYYLMGNGSNIVVSDDGIDGIVIRLGEKFSSIWTETKDDDPDHVYIHAYAGALLSKVSSRAVKHELTGLEFASGIPGSIGGAVFMNAGAYGRDMSCVVDSALCITNEGETYVIEGHEFAYGYRSSRFMALGGIVMSVVLKLERGDPEVIQATIKDLAEKRNASQPLNFPSAGCMFKRPEGYYAGVLIEEAGLKGVS